MKLKKILFLCFSLLIFHSSLLIATVRYASKTGTSQPPYTSWETAATSIQLCINACVDGDTIYVANGIYKENLVINTAISLIGSSMDSTVIDGTGLNDLTVVVNSDINISNFKFYGNGYNNTNTYTIWAPIQNTTLKISNCKLNESRRGISCVGSSLIANNIIIYRVVRGFVLYGNLASEFDIRGSSIILSDESSIGIDVGYAANSNFNIFNNLILSDATYGSYYGIYFGIIEKAYIYNNVLSEFLVNLNFGDVIDTTFIFNNIVMYKLVRGLEGDGAINTENDYAVIKNNIFQNNKDYAVRGFPPYVKMDYNLFWQNQNNLYGLTYGDSDKVADPMFVNDTIPTANGSYDFHLQKYSPAIDKGDPAILDVDGSRSDIGLFGGPYGESYTYQDLAPKPPANLSASLDSGLVHLKWNKNTEADLFRYRVYRDTVPDFIYDTTKIIAVLSDTTFYDDPPQKFISGNYYYKITAIDSAYNQSPASEEKHINITGIPEAPPIVVEHYRLLNNYPNPFNPSTTIPYRLKEPGYVKVMVYNLLGELVRVLVNQYQSAGYYEVLFHPTTTERKSAEGKIEFETGYGDIVSGIYLYRIEVIGEGNIPVFTDMKKMMLVK